LILCKGLLALLVFLTIFNPAAVSGPACTSVSAAIIDFAVPDVSPLLLVAMALLTFLMRMAFLLLV
jgi:hypothetical protein